MTSGDDDPLFKSAWIAATEPVPLTRSVRAGSDTLRWTFPNPPRIGGASCVSAIGYATIDRIEREAAQSPDFVRLLCSIDYSSERNDIKARLART